MKRLLFVGGQEHRDVVELLRRETPQFEHCQQLEDLPALLRALQPRLVVTGYVTPDQVARVLELMDQSLPLVIVCDRALRGSERTDLLGLLGERGTLLSPVDSTSLRATLRSWALPSIDPALLDSTALARIYAAGGRSLADRVVDGFLRGAPILAARAQTAFQDNQLQRCIEALESLSKQAGSVGAVEVCDAVDEILDELIEGGHVEPDQWVLLSRSLESSLRVLGEQKKQDRTA